MNVKLELQYDGSRYKGWQKQGNTDQTIQQKIEDILTKMQGTPIEIHGSGRTDAGVHALGQIANAKLKGCKDAEEVRTYLNTYLPEDIRVLSAEEAEERFHSRLQAKDKTYLYRIHKGGKPDVFTRKYTWSIEEELDLVAMRKAARYLIGEHDFKSLCGNRHFKKSTIREIYSIEILEVGEEIQIEVNGNGFLQNMVRILVGTLVEVGKKKRDPQQMKEMLEAKDRQRAGVTAPPQGLFLKEVRY